MKNELLLSTLLLANPVGAMSQGDMKSVLEISKSFKSELLDTSFETPFSILKRHYFYDSNGRWQEEMVKATITLKLVKADDYYDTVGIDGKMDYEVIAEYRNSETGELLHGDDIFFYAKKDIKKNRFTIYDCDSSATCRSENSQLEFSIYNSREGKVLKVKKTSLSHWDDENHLFSLLKKNMVLIQK